VSQLAQILDEPELPEDLLPWASHLDLAPPPKEQGLAILTQKTQIVVSLGPKLALTVDLEETKGILFDKRPCQDKDQSLENGAPTLMAQEIALWAKG
jgi:hypothetical protein